MKLLITLSFALLVFSGFGLGLGVKSAEASPVYLSLNANCTNASGKTCYPGLTCRLGISGEPSVSHYKCRTTVTPPSVPEFGLIPGAVAALSSGGAFLYLKKKKYN